MTSRSVENFRLEKKVALWRKAFSFGQLEAPEIIHSSKAWFPIAFSTVNDWPKACISYVVHPIIGQVGLILISYRMHAQGFQLRY